MEIGYKTSDDQIRKIVDMNTLKKISEAKSLQLPFAEIDVDEDKKWNARKINAEMLQAMEQGASIDDMAAKLMKVSDMNKNAAIRNARTMTTSFENLGRLDGMKAMRDNGVILKKQWLATHDDKTREAHRLLDGQTAEIDRQFVISWGEAIMYPGDPEAIPEMIYNCRCTLTYVIEGFEPSMNYEVYVYDVGENEKIKYIDSTIRTKEVKTINGEIIKLDIPLQYGNLDTNIDKETRDKIEKFEYKYLTKGGGVEWGMSVDDLGNNFTKGDAGHSEYLAGDVTTHIHPRKAGELGGTFSLADFSSVVNGGETTMRAVAKEGTYSFTKQKKFKEGEFGANFLKEFYELRNKYDQIYEEMPPKVFNRYLVEAHNLLLKNQKKYGYFYTLEMRGG